MRFKDLQVGDIINHPVYGECVFYGYIDDRAFLKPKKDLPLVDCQSQNRWQCNPWYQKLVESTLQQIQISQLAESDAKDSMHEYCKLFDGNCSVCDFFDHCKLDRFYNHI